MLRLTMLMCLVALILSTGTAQTDYTQYLIVSLTPKPDKVAAFEAGLAAHNKKFHTVAPWKVWVWSVVIGQGSGSYWYDMGPCSLADIDARKTTPEHDADWNNNVLAHCVSVGDAGYWRLDKDIKYEPEGSTGFSKSRLRFFTLKTGQRDRAEELLTKFAEVLKQKKYPMSYHVYWRFEASQGPHMAAALGVGNWSALDGYDGIGDAFEEVHGKGSYARFIEDLEMVVDVTKTYDQHIQLMPELSSNQ